MIDRFTELVVQLGNALDLPLFVDHLHACTLEIHDKIRIQLQLDPAGEKLLMTCLAIEIPPGKFRENVLKGALKANHLPDPRSAVLGYVAQNNHLSLHQIFPLSILDGQRLAGFLHAFLAEVENWVQAIEQGKSTPYP